MLWFEGSLKKKKPVEYFKLGSEKATLSNPYKSLEGAGNFF